MSILSGSLSLHRHSKGFLECNVACDYCFEHHEKHQVSLLGLRPLTDKLLGYMEVVGAKEGHIYWQGGEIMVMPPSWFEEANQIMSEASSKRGLQFTHYLQTNLIAYSSKWNGVIWDLFSGSIGTSMDYPNLYRKTKGGSAEKFTGIWLRNVRAAQQEGFHIGSISVLSPETIAAGAQQFYSFFVEDAGITDFQVNTPFPGGDSGSQSDATWLGRRARLLHDRSLRRLVGAWLRNRCPARSLRCLARLLQRPACPITLYLAG